MQYDEMKDATSGSASPVVAAGSEAAGVRMATITRS
jgi:hypothetical protein